MKDAGCGFVYCGFICVWFSTCMILFKCGSDGNVNCLFLCGNKHGKQDFLFFDEQNVTKISVLSTNPYIKGH